MNVGTLSFTTFESGSDLVAPNVKSRIIEQGLSPSIFVTAIDPDLADTAAFCEHYQIGMGISANCVVVEAKRSDKVWYAACIILATSRVDVNGAVRRHLNARKISFAPMEAATSLTKMEFGGITPVGLPSDWPILIDVDVVAQDYLIIGSGLRASKIAIAGSTLATLPGATVLNIKKTV